MLQFEYIFEFLFLILNQRYKIIVVYFKLSFFRFFQIYEFYQFLHKKAVYLHLLIFHFSLCIE